MSVESDHYLVLELKPGSPIADVKSQYRRLAKRYHPDLHGNDVRSQEQFRRVNAAYAFLSDPVRKAAYDSSLPLKTATPPQSSKPSVSRSDPRRRGTRPPAYTPSGRNPFASLADVKASRSVWFGGAALFVLVLLGIGFCLENGVGEREDHSGAVYAFSPNDGSSLLGSGLDPQPATMSPEVPFEAPKTAPNISAPKVPAPISIPKRSAAKDLPLIHAEPQKLETRKKELMGVASPLFPRRESAATASKATIPILKPVAIERKVTAIPPRHSHTEPVTIPIPPVVRVRHVERPRELMATGELAKPLLARYQTIVPQIDRLINQGYAVCDAHPHDSRTLQLKADLAHLNAVRDRVRPAISHLPPVADAKEVQHKIGPILTDLRHLEAHSQPVREDIQALAVPEALDPAPVASQPNSHAN